MTPAEARDLLGHSADPDPPRHQQRDRESATGGRTAAPRFEVLRVSRQARLLIMPAPTVTPVASSIRMNEPVVRFLEYGSHSSGTVVRSWTRPISLRPSSLVSWSRCSVLTSRRYWMSLTIARAGAGGVLDRQLLARPQRRRWSSSRSSRRCPGWASGAFLTAGRSCRRGRRRRRPRAGPSPTSAGTPRRSPGRTGRCPAIVEVMPLGSTTTSSPGFSTPPATWPAYPR